MSIEFLALGAWEVRDGVRPVPVPAGQMPVLLAALIMSESQPVPVDVLAGLLWPEVPPRRAPAILHTYVARLRRLLGREVIQTSPGGYRLAVDPSQVDLWRFRELLAQAGTAGSPEAELVLLREALALWRGQPFTGLAGTWLDREVVPALYGEWFAATERRIDLEARGGRITALIPDLGDLTRLYPARELLWSRLIEGLHLAGRRAEALETYRQARAALSGEVGAEPSDELQRIHRRVLLDGVDSAGSPPIPSRAEGVAMRSAPRPVPPARQLPRVPTNFHPRTESAQLAQLLADEAGDGPRPTRIVTIEGAPGVGKTTLALYWAHRVAPAYPDLQLYLDLHGFGPDEPLTPSAAALTVLRGLGVRDELIPPGADERSALFRSTVAGRRVLLLLDNVRDADQVCPLLPGPDSLVIVTARWQLRRLAIRYGARRVTLGRLTARESMAWLAAALGDEVVEAFREEAAALVEWCDGLPLALAVAAEQARRAGGLSELTSRHEFGLDLPYDGAGDPDIDLRVALSRSYDALGSDAAAMFRELGRQPAGEVSVDAAAAGAGLPARQAAQALDRLLEAHLVEQRHPRRYELPDLIRRYAASLTAP
jgi:DNA-binding SARP family transcriptional activator